MISEELGRPTVVDAHPKYAVALGAATLARRRRRAPTAGVAPARGQPVGPDAGQHHRAAAGRPRPAPAAPPSVPGARAGDASAAPRSLVGAGPPGRRRGAPPVPGPGRARTAATRRRERLGRRTAAGGPGGPPPHRRARRTAAPSGGRAGGRRSIAAAVVVGLALLAYTGYYAWTTLTGPSRRPPRPPHVGRGARPPSAPPPVQDAGDRRRRWRPACRSRRSGATIPVGRDARLRRRLAQRPAGLRRQPGRRRGHRASTPR